MAVAGRLARTLVKENDQFGSSYCADAVGLNRKLGTQEAGSGRARRHHKDAELATPRRLHVLIGTCPHENEKQNIVTGTGASLPMKWDVHCGQYNVPIWCSSESSPGPSRAESIGMGINHSISRANSIIACQT